MSANLHFPRLSLLLKNHLAEHRQKYLFYTLGMFFIGLLIVTLILAFNSMYSSRNIYLATDKIIYPTNWEIGQTTLYLGGLAIFGILFSSVSFVNFNNKGEAIFYLIKPASQLEKWLTQIIVHVFLFFFVYTLVFYVIDIPATFFVRHFEQEYFKAEYKTWSILEQQTKLFRPSSFFHFAALKEAGFFLYPFCISAYLSVVAFFLYGAVLYNRFSFFKTLFLGFVTSIAYLIYKPLYSQILIKLILPSDWSAYAFENTAYSRGEGYAFEATLPEFWGMIAVYFLLLFVPAVLLTCSYFKLKEKEI